MRPRGKSLRTRLILGAMTWITVITVVSWFALTELLRGHTQREFIEELDHHASELVNLTTIDGAGRLQIRAPLSDHRFMTPDSGYYWQMERPNGEVLRSPSLGGARLPLASDFGQWRDNFRDKAPGPTGPLLLLERVIHMNGSADALRVAVATDARLVDELMRELNRTLAVALGGLAVGLIGASMAQITYGLRPVRRIRLAVQAVGRGERRRLPSDLPAEVAPLAANVNALLDLNEEMIRRARVQAGNLAHALKTPLALLLDEGRRLEANGQGGRLVIEQCERMRRQIDYQLARARAAASHNQSAGATPVAPAIRAVVAAVERLQQHRGLAIEVTGLDRDPVVKCEAEDFDEIIGNLLDNAAKWARSNVLVRVSREREGFITIRVEDDGPGMPPDARERVFEVGERLDEMTPGTGLGLAIVRDLAQAYGGRAWIAEAAGGGTAACVELPAG